jgi:hypothetical protein
MDRNWNQYLTRYRTATIPSPLLPQSCPNCGAEIAWGWSEEEFEEPFEGCTVRIHCIPRPDQTVFCPSCEAQILN